MPRKARHECVVVACGCLIECYSVRVACLESHFATYAFDLGSEDENEAIAHMDKMCRGARHVLARQGRP